MANDRLSQLVVEVVVAPTSQKARVSQEVVEVIVNPNIIPPTKWVPRVIHLPMNT